jgi:dolichol-phosphate mannosyltransferase
MRDLYEYAAEHASDDDVIVRMDCDDTHEPQYIPALINRLSDTCDVVIASRFAPGGGQHGVSRYRATLSRAANFFMKCVFPINGVREYSCGYRAYRGAIIRRAVAFYGNNFIQLKGLGFTGTLEKLTKLHLLGARIGEVGFQLRYDQKQSSSKMVSSITTLGYFTMAICYYWPWGGWLRNWGSKARQLQGNPNAVPGRNVPQSVS